MKKNELTTASDCVITFLLQPQDTSDESKSDNSTSPLPEASI